MVEKRHREALKANNRMKKHGNCKPPKQKIKIMIGEIAVKWENHLSTLKLHDHSSLPPGTLSTKMPSHPSGEVPREPSWDCCSSVLKEQNNSSLSVPSLLQHSCCSSERTVSWGNILRLDRGRFL